MAKEVIRISHTLEPAVSAACHTFERGGVVVFPTETVYGIGVISADPDALARLARLKQRSDGKPFQLLVSGRDMAVSLGARFSPGACRLADTLWPGPLTLVVPDAAGATLGVRAPRSAFMLEVLRELGRAVVSSSANPAGLPPPTEAALADVFGDDVDLLVDGGPSEEKEPSTVVSCGENDFTILRQGALAEAEIRGVWHV